MSERSTTPRRGDRPVNETTTATVEDAARIIESTAFYTGARTIIDGQKAAQALADAGLLATDRPETATEVAARALEDAANDGADVPGPDSWLKFKSIWGSNDADAQTLNFAVWVSDWLRKRAARLRTGAE